MRPQSVLKPPETFIAPPFTKIDTQTPVFKNPRQLHHSRIMVDKNIFLLSYLTHEPVFSLYIKCALPVALLAWPIIPVFQRGEFWTYVAREFEWSESFTFALDLLLVYGLMMTLILPITLVVFEFLLFSHIKFLEIDDERLKTSWNHLSPVFCFF